MKLISAGDLESADPVMPVRWCLEPKDVAVLAEHNVNVNSASVVFVIVDDRHRESRQVAPMTQMMEYLHFHRPGAHRVFAAIISGETREVKKHILEKRREFDYRNDLLNYDETAFLVDRWCATEMDVMVPKEQFPKEPPAWLRALVEWGHEYPSIDQCQFRRRLLLSVPKLFFAGIWAVITTFIRACVAIVFGGLFTLRDVNYRAVIHPWHFNIDDVLRGAEFSISWLFHKRRKGRAWVEWRSWWMLLLYPPIWGAACLTVYIVAAHLHIGFFAAAVLVLVALWYAIWWGRWIVGGIALVAFALYLASLAKQKKDAGRDYEAEWRENQERARKEREAFVGLLTCNTQPMVVQLQAIPPERRTLHLHYLNLKAKVCRPFAR